MCTEVCTTSSSMDQALNRDSNSAGAPLPLIPRRTASSSSLRPIRPHATTPHKVTAPLIDTTPPKVPSASAILIVQPPTPDLGADHAIPDPAVLLEASEPRKGLALSSLNSFSINVAPRARRVRGQRTSPLWSPEDSPTLAFSFSKSSSSLADSADNTSGAETVRPHEARHTWSGRSGHNRLRLQSEGDLSHQSTPNRGGIIVPTSTPWETPTIRKKSGELVKSSLKSRKRPIRGDLSVVTDALPVRSEPTTPNKSVHFKMQLEQVKLFLAEQKPLAVSRDGSPTDTSEGDSDFPSFIYGSTDEEKTMKVLVMQVVNMPESIPKDADVAVEELVLSRGTTTITGRVRVRNLAFEKRVAVRFTFDWWQTTSEVTAKYVESTDDGVYDRFSFVLRLNDILARIEEKTLYLAVRYTAAGREIWDNNGGQNYQAKFSKSKPSVAPKRESDDEAKTSRVGMADLKSKLEEVAKGRETIGSFLTSTSRRGSDRMKFSLKSDTSLSSRYDFAVSSKTPWKANVSPSPSLHSRTRTYPSDSPNSIPWPAKRSSPSMASPNKSTSSFKGESSWSLSRGSPRAEDEEFRPVSMHFDADDEDRPFSVSSPQNGNGRNHQRGYFDIHVADPPQVRRTVSGSPIRTNPPADSTPTNHHLTPLSPSRSHSFPPADGTKSPGSSGMLSPSLAAFRRAVGGASDETTPSITSSSDSSRSTSPEPSPLLSGTPTGGYFVEDERQMNLSNYSAFLNRFCFYTGMDSLLDVPPDVVPRSHSASSIEDCFTSPRSSSFSLGSPSPTRSPSFDDILRSGSTTPTTRTVFA